MTVQILFAKVRICFLQGLLTIFEKRQKNGGWKFLSPPAILKCILSLKTQNFAVKSFSENRFNRHFLIV